MAKKKIIPKENITLNIQAGTERTIYAVWKWTVDHTENYEVKWYYYTANRIWFIGNESTAKEKQSIYSPPDNATKVKIKIKPISKKYKKKVNGKEAEVSHWPSDWSVAKVYTLTKDVSPEKPSVPDVSIKQYTLTASVDTYDKETDGIEFQIVQDHSKAIGKWRVPKKKNHVELTCNVEVGHGYKVRCRGLKGDFSEAMTTPGNIFSENTTDIYIGDFEYGEWSEYSQNVATIPEGVPQITICAASSQTSARVEWSKVNNAESYTVEYTTNKDWFDVSSEVQSTTIEAHFARAEITGLESGKEYFFRVQAVNGQGESGWSAIASTILGKAPAAPTTWSTTTTASVGENVILYWVHNSEDGSSQTYAELELTVDGVQRVITVQNSTNADEKDKTSSYTLTTSGYTEGAVIQWRVRTKGVVNEYGDWSIQRTIDVYAPPVVSLLLSGTCRWHWDTFNFEKDDIFTAYGDLGDPIGTLTSLPLYVLATAGPHSQTPIGYYLTVSSNEAYQTADSVGKTIWVNAGEMIFSKHYDVSEHQLFVPLTASELNLENGVTYTVHCIVSMNSGLTAEAFSEFTVEWTDEQYEPDAEIIVDDTFTAYIRPYCEDDEGNLINGVLLSVYRREFDGKFTELAVGIDNMHETFITDPHPALDYARYRIVAVSRFTGSISYYDPPGYPVGGIAAILQWAEEWTNFDAANEDEAEIPIWSGSLLKLPYNIDVSDSHGVDVSLVEYIGRSHPVSYYGTQLGETSTWNVEIPSDDEETLYALRRLAVWMGDVYVREPSGTGYWAHVKVSFSQKHCAVTIPVTLDITRVEGGV